jgi:hypothetical protein
VRQLDAALKQPSQSKHLKTPSSAFGTLRAGALQMVQKERGALWRALLNTLFNAEVLDFARAPAYHLRISGVTAPPYIFAFGAKYCQCRSSRLHSAT